MTGIQEVIDFVERIAPPSLQEEWDNSGLQVGNGAGRVNRILVALTPSPAVVGEAISKKVQLLITHHPLIFGPLKTIRLSTPAGKTLESAIKHDLSIYSCHTSLDKAAQGTSKILAERLGLQEIKPLMPKGELLKLAVFIPQERTQKVLDALAEAGAGHIGNYSHCSFRVQGTGTYLPLEGSTPFIGRKGALEEVKEDRLEMIFPFHIKSKVIDALLKSHPYEEVAYDLYPLENADPRTGLGAIGRLKEPLSDEAFISALKKNLKISTPRIAGQKIKMIERVACLGGSGKFIKEALRCGVDAYVTGDVGYHEALEAEESGMLLIDAGHHATEWPVMEEMNGRLAEQFPDIEILLSGRDRDPFFWT